MSEKHPSGGAMGCSGPFGCVILASAGVKPCSRIAKEALAPERRVIPAYRSAETESDKLALQKGRRKLMFYFNFAPELSDLYGFLGEVLGLADRAQLPKVAS